MYHNNEKLYMAYENKRLKVVILLSFIVSYLIQYTYSSSSLLVYGILIGSVTLLTYFFYIKSIHFCDSRLFIIVTMVLIVSLFNSLVRGDFIDGILTNLSIVMPFAFANMDFSGSDKAKTWSLTAVVGMICIYILVRNGYQTLTTGTFNENSIAFLAFMAFSFGFCWFKLTERKLFCILFFIVSFYIVAITKCRNVLVVFPICLLLLLLPSRIWEKKGFYRCIVVMALALTIFTSVFLTKLSSSSVYTFLNDYLIKYSSGKQGSVLGRIQWFNNIWDVVENLSPLDLFFGRGLRGSLHCHNMFLQTLIIYGIFGTILIYLFYFMVFEKLRKLIVADEKRKNLYIGCTVILIGHFLLNAFDLYIIGTSGAAVVPQLIIGLVLRCSYEVHINNEVVGR